MSKLIGQHYEGDVRVRWTEDGEGNINVARHQDAQAAVDLVAAVNRDGAPTHDGLGKPIGEVPIVAAMDWAAQRGIPWEKLLYGNEYDSEFKAFIREHSRLAYANTKSVHALQ